MKQGIQTDKTSAQQALVAQIAQICEARREHHPDLTLATFLANVPHAGLASLAGKDYQASSGKPHFDQV